MGQYLCRRMGSVFRIPEGCVDAGSIPAPHRAYGEELLESVLEFVRDEVASQNKVEAFSALPKILGSRPKPNGGS
ncbi:hypothetical protein WJ99_11175 [Burkholderia ubonensis]|nr:hypothetical protein WJ93_14815 [Burkholderia ubonensis]KVQ13106.1 hypothetical protein WJ99_11175 [Burkholderia ubonensis]KVU91782.1 hypothetical protein WK76_14565 [Burkholderia ubonensis]KWO90806.1 hypothetical protein WM32_03940 [Burkholderia ubonensis]OJB38370.1 hypothetical protein BGV56_08150 [Burkholderia ubonensis]